jgi:hypothetical protein
MCGLDVPGSKFCRRCGASLHLHAHRTATAHHEAAAQENARRTRLRGIAVLSIIVVVLAGGALAWLALRGVAPIDTGQTIDQVPPEDLPVDDSRTAFDPGAPPLLPPEPPAGGDQGFSSEQPLRPLAPPELPAPPVNRRPAVEPVSERPVVAPPRPEPAAPVVSSAPAETPSAPAPASLAPIDPPPTAPAAAALVLPPGLQFAVSVRGTLSSKTAVVEDRFEAVTVGDVHAGDSMIPAGSLVRGIVTAVQPGTRTNRTSRLSVAFDQITVNGRSYPIRGTTDEIVGRGLKGEAVRVGVGAGIGALLGGILGGAKGAAAGAAIGGTGTVVATEGQEVELADGTMLNVTLR